MDDRATIDGLARRNAELQAQLDQMTKNRDVALEENERKRETIQQLKRELEDKQIMIQVLQEKIGDLVRDREEVQNLRL